MVRVDSEKGDTKVVLYFDSLTRKEVGLSFLGFVELNQHRGVQVCPTIEAYRTYRVAQQKPAPVLVYDYYDQSRRARSFYDVVPATLCDICEEEVRPVLHLESDSLYTAGLP